MFIGDLARQTGIPTTSIRYYESVGLMDRPQRAENNYRQYTPADLEKLRLISSARSLGFNLDEIHSILKNIESGSTACQRVLALVEEHMKDIEQRIADLHLLHDALEHMRCKTPQDTICSEDCICSQLGTYSNANHYTQNPPDMDPAE